MKHISLSILIAMSVVFIASNSEAKMASSLNPSYDASVFDVQDRLSLINEMLGHEDALVLVLSGKSEVHAILKELEAVEDALLNGKKLDVDGLIHLACRVKECN